MGQKIRRLAPTGMSLSCSIYNTMKLKIISRKQVRKTPRLSSLSGNMKIKRTSLLRGAPTSPLAPPGSRTTSEHRNEVCCVQTPGLCLAFNLND